jgi:hypothetical protein
LQQSCSIWQGTHLSAIQHRLLSSVKVRRGFAPHMVRTLGCCSQQTLKGVPRHNFGAKSTARAFQRRHCHSTRSIRMHHCGWLCSSFHHHTTLHKSHLCTYSPRFALVKHVALSISLTCIIIAIHERQILHCNGSATRLFDVDYSVGPIR